MNKKKIKALLLGTPFISGVALFVAYLLFGYLTINPLAQRLLPWVAENQLASRLTLGQVKFDPLSLEFDVNNFHLTRPDGGALASFDHLYVNLQLDSLFRFAWHLREIRISQPDIRLEIRKDGRFNWAELLAKLNEDSKPSATMPRVLIDRLQIDAGRVHYAELNRDTPVETDLTPLSLQVGSFSTLPEDRGDYLIAATLEELGGRLRWKGTLGVNPLASTGAVDLQGVQLGRLAKLLRQPIGPLQLTGGEFGVRLQYDFAMVADKAGPYPRLQLKQVGTTLAGLQVALEPRGKITLGRAEASIAQLDARLQSQGLQLTMAPLNVTLRELQWINAGGLPLRAAAERIDVGLKVSNIGGAFAVDGLNAELQSLSLQPTRQAEPVARLASIRLVDGALNPKDSAVKIAAITLSGLQTRLVINQDKSVNWLALLQPAGTVATAKPAASAKAAPSPWKVELDKLRLEKVNVRIEDLSTPQPVALDVQDASVEIGGASLNLAKPVAVKAALALRQGGRLDVRGKLAPQPAQGDLQVRLSGLQLKPYSPYLNQFVLLNLASGELAVRGKLAFRSPPSFSENRSGKFSGKFSGGFSINKLAINEEGDGTPFLLWDSMASESLSVSLAPNRLQLNELRIVHPTGRFIIHEDKSINVQRLLRAPASQSAMQPASAPPAGPAPKDTSAAESFAIAVERISVADGDLEFADLSLRPQFGTHIHNLDGVINGLSSDAASTAQVELDGKVDDYGSARVRGSVQPFRATEFTDLKVGFHNLEMTRLTPYSGKFAGRKIDSGKLSVDLEYKIKNRKLFGENKFVINTIKLGERVDSRDAFNLPLDLAIVLMEDSQGVIDIDLPISGSLDDPQFSYGKIIWKAIVNVLSKVVTAPFRALGKLLGISAEQMEAVAFDPGMSTLSPPEQEKLKSVAGALAKKAALTLKIIPSFDLVADKAALQELRTRREVIAELGLKLNEGEQPGPLDLGNVKVQTAIANLLKDRSGEGRGLKMLDTVKDYFRESTPEDQARSAALLERLKASVPVSEAELAALGKARAAAIRAYLVDAAGLDAARISIGEPDKATLQQKAVPVKLALGVKKGD